MQHPFIGDLSNLTVDEIQTKINDLTSKLSYCYRTQNQVLIRQLHMAIDSYKAEYIKKINDLYKKNNIQDKIVIKREGEK
jgi:hypothetical protein